MLLPETFSPRNAPECLIAVSPDGALAGAASIGWRAVGDPPAFPVSVHVLPRYRRQGLGRALLDAAAALVRGQALALQPWKALREDSETAAFCLACGFAVHHRFLHFLAEADKMETMLATYREKLDRAGRIPPGARVVPLSEAPAAEVANLLSREFHNDPERTRARLEGRTANPPDPGLSAVLLLDGVVAGAQLVRIADDGVPELETNVIIPSLRRGWANVLLLTHDGTRPGARHDARYFRFFCDERVTDTVKLARRSGAQRTAIDVVLRRAVV
jgi:GNAT superfamily N-acetyltransferase